MDQDKPQANPAPAAPQPIAEADLDPRTRAQVRKELHQKKQEERKAAAEALHHEYQKLKDEPAIADIIRFAKQMAAYHTKMAKDGVGAKNMGVDDSGAPIIEDYRLSSEERLSELDQAKGIEQIVSYIEQKLA